MTTKYQATCDTCGYTTTSKTQGLARYALSRHSCAKHQRLTQRAARHAAHMATVDRTPKPCHHKRANHQHGTHACYVLDSCRCPQCAGANRAYENRRAKLHAYGRFTNWVAADTARAHIETLKASGMGLRTIAKHSGVTESALGKIIYGDPSRNRGPSKRVRADTQTRILTVRPGTLADGARTDGTGTRRRLQALAATGWSQPRLAELLGWEIRNLNALINGRRSPTVTAATARTVTDLYDRLWDQEPPAANRWQEAGITRARATAAKHGWAPPLAWDDDTIDDPTARPTGAGASPQRLTSDELVAEIEHHLTFVDRSATAQQVGNRLGVTRYAIQRGLTRAGRTDLLDLLNTNAETYGQPNGHATKNRKDTAA